FDEPVTIRFEVPAGSGIFIEPITIAKGNTEGTATVVATGAATTGAAEIKTIAEAKAGTKSLTAQTSVHSIVSEPGRALADVFFVLDVTASMDNPIRGVADGIGGFAKYLRDNKIDFRVGLVAFRDLWHKQDEANGLPLMQVLRFKGDTFTTDDVEF